MKRVYEFFIICPIGLEELLEKEILTIIPQSLFKSHKIVLIRQTGGIELTGPVMLLELARYLKIATKITLRITKDQKCRDFPTLFNKLKKIKWSQYLPDNSYNFALSFSSEKSRILDDRKALKCLHDALKSLGYAYGENALKNELIMRFKEDRYTLSINVTGFLFKRSESSNRGKAGLRENMAFALIAATIGEIETQSHLDLIDPLCGSGTIVREALNWNQAIECEFPYLNFPLYQKKKLSNDNLRPLSPFLSCKGFDQNKALIENLKLEYLTHQATPLLKDRSNHLVSNTLVISNLPYGKRIKLPSKPSDFFPQLYHGICQSYGPEYLGFLIAENHYLELKKLGFKKILSFKNNGIKVCVVFKKRKGTVNAP